MLAAKQPSQGESEFDLDGRIQLLKGFPLFSELDEAELGLIAEKMEELHLEAKAELLTQNEDAEAVYFLKEGAVKILVNGEMVAQVDTVQCFGEMSCLIPNTPASASVVTANTSFVLKVSRSDFLEVVNRIPKLWKTLFLQMNSRAKAVNMRLSEVLEHTPQGLIKVDRKGVITNEYSIQCTRYFGRDNLSGIDFAELIHPANEDARGLWAQTYPMLFEEGTLTFQDIADLLDRELTYRLEDGGTKEFVFSYYPCRNIAGAIEAIDIGIEDVTEARELERKNVQMLAEQSIMGKIYENPESFLNLRKFAVQTLSVALAYIKGLQSGQITYESESTKDCLRKLHSLKGYAGIFALKPVQDATHHLEDLIKTAQASGSTGTEAIQPLAHGLSALKEQYFYMEALFNRIGESLRKRLLGVAFTQAEFERLKEAADRGDTEEIQRLTRVVEKIDATKLISAWPDEAAKIAAALGKDVEVTLDGEGGSLPKRIFEDLDRVLVHFLRNAIDHGLETPEEREEAGKASQGTLRVMVEASDGELHFEIEDDGRGIDFDHLAEMAAGNERIDDTAIERLVAGGEPWKILFLPGFTTAPEITDVSGRGVGLDAVKSLVDSHEGTVEVESTIGQRTLFRVRIPVKEE